MLHDTLFLIYEFSAI